MATSHNLEEINKEVSQDVLHVYEVQREINELVANICNAILNLDMHKEICDHIQALICEPPSLHGLRELD